MYEVTIPESYEQEMISKWKQRDQEDRDKVNPLKWGVGGAALLSPLAIASQLKNKAGGPAILAIGAGTGAGIGALLKSRLNSLPQEHYEDVFRNHATYLARDASDYIGMGANHAERLELTKHLNSMSMAERAAMIDKMYEHPDPANFSHPIAKRWAANEAAELDALDGLDAKKASLASIGGHALAGATVGGITGFGLSQDDPDSVGTNSLTGALVGAAVGGGVGYRRGLPNVTKAIPESHGLPVPHINMEAQKRHADKVWEMHKQNIRDIEAKHGINMKDTVQSIKDNHAKHEDLMKSIHDTQAETSKAIADANKSLDELIGTIPNFHKDLLRDALRGDANAKRVVEDIPKYMKEHGLEMSHFSKQDQHLIRKNTITKLSSENVGLGALCGGLGLMSTLGKEASHPYMHDENEFVAEKGEYKHQSVPKLGLKRLAEGAFLGSAVGLTVGSFLGSKAAIPAMAAGLASGSIAGGVSGVRQAYRENKAFTGNQPAYESHLRDRFRRFQLPLLEDDEATFMDAVSVNPMSGGSRMSSLSPEHARINQANVAERDKIRQMSSAAYQNYLNKLRADYQNLNRKEREMAYEEVVYNGMPYSKEAGLKFPARLMSAEALGSAAVGAVGGYLTAEPGDKMRSVAMGAVAGAGMGAAFRPHIRAGINQIKALDAQKLTQTPGPKVDMPDDFLKKNPGGAPPKPQQPGPILKPSTSRYPNGTVRPKGF